MNRESDKQIIIMGKLNIRGHDQIKRVYSIDGIAPTLSTMQGGAKTAKDSDTLFFDKFDGECSKQRSGD